MTKRSEIRDDMQIEWDLAIAMDDGIILRADVFRPVGPGKYPVILSYGPYAKGLSFQEGYKGNWARLIEAVPEILVGSTNKYQNWELVDPEKWVPEGARRGISTYGRRGKHWTFTDASNGPARNPGAAARWGSTAFPITQ